MSNLSYSFETDYSNLTAIKAPFEVRNRYGDIIIDPDFLYGFSDAPNNLSGMFTGNFGGFTITPRFLSADDTISDTNFFIDFGDGTVVYNNLSAYHRYELPGDYNVTLCVYNSAGNVFKSAQTCRLNVKDVISDKIFLSKDSDNQNLSESTVKFYITRWNSTSTSRVLSSNKYKIDLAIDGNQSQLVTETDYETNSTFQFTTSSFIFTNTDDSFKVVDGVETTSKDIFAEIINKEIIFSSIKTDSNYMVGTSGMGSFRIYEPITTRSTPQDGALT